MTPQLSPESLEQIRLIVQQTIEAAFRGQEPRFEGIERRFEAIDRRFDAIDGRFEAIDRQFDAINGRFEAMDQRFDAMDLRFDAMDVRFGELRREVHEAVGESRRHFGVLNENLTGKIELVVEGVVGTNQRVDRLERETHDSFARVDRRLIAISAHMTRPARRPRQRRPRRRRKG